MSEVGSTSGSSLPHSTRTGTRTASSASFVRRWVMNMASMIDANAVAVPASRSGCSRAASRPSSHRSTCARETRPGSPPTRPARPPEMAPASVIAVRLASRMRRPASRSRMRVAGGPAVTARRPSVCHASASAGDIRRHGSVGATRTTPRVWSGISPAASAATRPPVDQPCSTTWPSRRSCADEGRHEACVEVCAWPAPIRITGVARDGPREVDGDHRPELSQVRNEVDPHARAAGHRGHQQVNRCISSSSRSGLRADVVHGHAAHARRHAAQPRPLLGPDAPVVVSHADPTHLPSGTPREHGIRLQRGDR